MDSKLSKFFALILMLGFAGGCATTADTAAAEKALAKANAALAEAQRASNTASEAAYTASQAQADANAALECCNDNTSRLDRMFEKTMSK